MNSNLILKSDILDIIFEKRNKDYGAYTLRKFYSSRLKLSLGIVFIIVAAFSVSTFIFNEKPVLRVREYIFDDSKLADLNTKLEEPKQRQDPPKTETRSAPVNTVQYTSNPVITNNTPVETIQAITETTGIGTTTVINVDPGPATVQPVKTGTGTEAAPVIDKTVPMDLNSVDIAPSYPGGIEALRKFLERNLNNPKEMEEGESVSVRIRFIVGYDGKLQSFVTVLDGGDEFNKEVVRVLKKMPAWIPGKARGENVSVYYTIPVKFVPAN